jgi:hypothetical protein
MEDIMDNSSTLSAFRCSYHAGAATVAIIFIFCTSGLLYGSPGGVEFTQSARNVDTYCFVEITLNVKNPDAENPFVDAIVEGWFASGDGQKVHVDGFCDSLDGSKFRIRFMPTESGKYRYSITYRQGSYECNYNGRFTAKDSGRRGLVRVDKDHPWHFIWEGTGEHYFWNGTTTYWLMGWDDETIRSNIDRLSRLKVNRLRVAINGRVKNGRAWYENIFPTEKFTFLLNPWVAKQPNSVEKPEFDVTRFNIGYWRKIERMLHYAREKDMVISIIFYVDGRRPGVDPFKDRMGGEDEQRYYQYGVARLAAFSNVMWDVTNEYRLFRNDEWAEKMGSFIEKCDPYDHLTSVHGHGDFRFQTSPWADFAMYQRWDEAGGYRFMLANRREQAETGRIIPQVNEEYGYEDHYPTWGGNRKAPARSADNRRRLAWGIYMAGCYQTTGERANTGTGWGPDTGGGWLNGRGDDSMKMLIGYGHIVDFFTSVRWWELNPDNSFFTTPSQTSVRTKLTHIVYTRDKASNATFYLDGQEQATRKVTGDCSNWDSKYRLALANELTRDRPWLGELHRVAIYDSALGRRKIERNFKAGFDETSGSQIALYNFQEGRGDAIKDISDAGKPLNLRIRNTSAVKWLSSGGLRVKAPALISSVDSASKVICAVRKSHEITIEAWIKPANVTQTGPARIVTVSSDPGQRNFTLGQKGGAYEMRFRTTSTSRNGEPALSTPGGEDDPKQICGLRNDNGDLAVIYFPAGGSVTVKEGTLASGLKSRWYNPRSGRWTPAGAGRGNSGTLSAPDEKDWAMLFQKTNESP